MSPCCRCSSDDHQVSEPCKCAGRALRRRLQSLLKNASARRRAGFGPKYPAELRATDQKRVNPLLPASATLDQNRAWHPVGGAVMLQRALARWSGDRELWLLRREPRSNRGGLSPGWPRSQHAKQDVQSHLFQETSFAGSAGISIQQMRSF
jgi:hypothetical protein